MSCLSGFFSTEIDSKSCDLCGLGEFTTEGMSACLGCDAGMYGSEQGKCSECPAGRYQDTKGKQQCIKCKLGELFINTKTPCSGCDLGMYGSEQGKCSECPAGRYQDGKGATNCNDCPVDTFLSEQGKASKADCRLCDKMRGTAGMTAVASSDMCLCKGSTVYKPDGTSDGYYGGYNSEECKECEKGGRCDFDGATVTNLTSQTGFWRSSLTSKDFSDCSKGYQGLNAAALAADRCCPIDPITKISICFTNGTEEKGWNSDSQCQQNYRGTLCLECVEGHVRVGDECIVCPEGVSLDMAFMAGVLMVVPVFLGVLINLLCEGKTEKASSAGNKVFGQIKIMITFVQILSSMKTTYNGIPWPLAFMSFVVPLAVINLDVVGLFGANICSMAVPFSGKFIVHMSLPPMLSFGIIAAYFASKRLKPPKTKELLSHRHAQTMKLLLGLILFMYPGLATRCFQMFKCSEFDGVDYQVLEADPSMKCHVGDHNIFTALSFVFICICELKVVLYLYLCRCELKVVSTPNAIY